MEELKEKFKQLQFDEKDHKYFVEGNNLTATSNMIKSFYEEFDTEGHSFRYAKKHRLKQDDVKKMWRDKGETAADNGTEVHNYAEQYGKGIKAEPSNKQEETVVKWFKDLPEYYVIASLELQMYSLKYKYAGTADKILFDIRTKQFVIADYKTNKEDIFKGWQYQNMMYEPFEFLVDCSYNHYQLQLSFYQIMLEDAGFPVSDRMLIWLKEDNYQKFNTYDYTPLLREWLDKQIAHDN